MPISYRNPIRIISQSQRICNAWFNGVTLAIEKRREAEARHREAQRLAAQELDLAKQVEMRLLLQPLRAIPTVDFAAICLQARVVGGDYCDFFDLGGDRLGFVVGAIAGKGMSAALLMANLQAALRARVRDWPIALKKRSSK
jgi:phosphoserine phosphatase RsbU/P